MKIKHMQVGAVIVGACLLSANGADLVTNGSFEKLTTDVSDQWKKFDGEFKAAGWESELGTMSDSAVGIAKTKNGTWFSSSCETPVGNCAVFFSCDAKISQDIDVTEPGIYAISLKYVSRGGAYTNGLLYVKIDEATVGDPIDVGKDNTRFRYAERRTYLDAGQHKLTIYHSAENNPRTNGNGGAGSSIDAVTVQKVVKKVEDKDNLVKNGGFEDYIGSLSGIEAVFSGSFKVDDWEYGTGTGLATTNSNFLSSRSGSPYEGNVSLFFNGSGKVTGKISQNVMIPEDGTYEISFVYAPRNMNNYAGGRVNVWIDDTKVGYVDCDKQTTQFRRCTIRVPMTAGSHEFKLTHTLDNPVSTTNDPCSAIDDVSIVKVDGGNLLANGGFEDYIGTLSGIEALFNDSIKVDTWKYEGGTGLATTNSNFLSNKSGSPYEGNVSLYFNGAHSVSQTVYVAETGDYDISFAYAPRDTVNYYGGRLHVVIDGEEACDSVSCDNATSTFRRYMVRIPISAGLHVFQLRHTIEDNTHHTACSAVDAVDMRAADNLIMNGSFDMGTVSLNNGQYTTASEDKAYSNPGWVSSGTFGLARSGSPWVSSNLSPTGKYSLFMHTANYNGRKLNAASTWQSFNVATQGVYELRFSYASRPSDYYKGGMIYARVYKGEGTAGSPIYERSVTADSLTDFVEFVGNVKFHEPGKYTLQFYAPQPEYTETAENNRGVVIDNVSVEYAGKLPGLMIIFK